jgi:lipid-A-disaccharide synthase
MIIPEFIDHDATAEVLAATLSRLLQDSPERRRQIDAFGKLEELMCVKPHTPSGRAADAVLATVRQKKSPARGGVSYA